MRRPGGRAGREAGRRSGSACRGRSGEIPSAGGAPGGAAFRWQGFARLQIAARARLGTGLANPSEWASQPIQARLRRQSGVTPGCHRGASQTPGASRRSIPRWGRRKKGPAAPTPKSNNRAAQHWLRSEFDAGCLSTQQAANAARSPPARDSGGGGGVGGGGTLLALSEFEAPPTLAPPATRFARGEEGMYRASG